VPLFALWFMARVPGEDPIDGEVVIDATKFDEVLGET
jgi:hypothetical protein